MDESQQTQKFTNGSDFRDGLFPFQIEVSSKFQLVWIYIHDEYAKRPEEQNLKDLLRELLD